MLLLTILACLRYNPDDRIDSIVLVEALTIIQNFDNDKNTDYIT